MLHCIEHNPVRQLFVICINLCIIGAYTSATNLNYAAVKAEPIGILTYDQQEWRNKDYEFFLWDKLDRILIFDIAAYAIQDRLFKKLAFFTEKRGYTGKVYTEAALAGKHGYNAHNYSAFDLAAYFNLAPEANLNTYEISLKEILIANRILLDRDGILFPLKGGLISISRESVSTLRKHLLSHELLHGIYYNLPALQEKVHTLWESLSDMEREFWFLYFWSNGYETKNPNVLINEFYGYLLQQTEKNIDIVLFNRAVENIKEDFPGKAEFLNVYIKDCRSCLPRQARAVAQLLTDAGTEAGFDYLAYLNSFSPY